MGCLLGIDVSTTGAKALLIDERGKVAASATTEYPLSTPRPLWSEQSPDDWWRGACASNRAVLSQSGVSADEVIGVGLTGQMHGLVLLGKRSEPLRPAILWNDQRTAEQCDEIVRRVHGSDRALELTGNPVLPGFTAPKLLWVRQHEPDLYQRIGQVLLPKDYVRYRLTGEFSTDLSDASGTSLLDVAHRRWSAEMLDALEVPTSWMPPCHESPEVCGRVSEAGAAAMGLRPGTPVVAGAGDQAAQAVGTGVTRSGIVSVTSGTSGVVFAHSDQFVVDPHGRLHSFCHAVPGTWHVMGVMLSAGGSLRWLRDTLGEPERAVAALTRRDPYDLLTREASAVPAGSDGLLFLPYLTGERTPHADPEARGAFVGLTARHRKGHLVRSVLEGVSFGLRDALELIRDLGMPIEQVRVSGGGAKSPLWRQIQSDILEMEVELVSVGEGAAYGAALLAAVGVGLFGGVEEAVGQTVRTTERIVPDPDRAALYQRLYPVYRSLYPSLQTAFHELARQS